MLSVEERKEALEEITGIASAAAALVMHGYRRPNKPRVEYKGEIDLVTNFDRASEDLIRTMVAKSFPGCDLVAEEDGGRAAGGGKPVFYVDPLDGTTNFSHGHPFFAVSIGMYVDGTPELGVVVAPALGWTYAAARGCGATRNDEPCRVSRTEVLDRSLCATGFPYDRRTSPKNNFRAFVEVKKRAQGVRRCGAAAIDLALVADGTYDAYWEHKLRTWDAAAGTVLVLEAGGTISGFDGAGFDLHTGSIVASNGLVHAELLGTLGAAEALPPL